MHAKQIIGLLLAGLTWPAVLAAAPPPLVNARLQTHSAATGLEATVRPILTGAGPVWLGYAVPSTGRHESCCDCVGGSCRGGCRLENQNTFTLSGGDHPLRLEPLAETVVLLRSEGGQVEKVRTVSPDCELDVGGLPFHWIADVRPAESVGLLASLVSANETKAAHRRTDGALAALAQHSDPAAAERLASMARNYQSRHVRGQALFWLAQMAGKKSALTITEAIENDPDTEVKKKAVFALSQLPKDEGVPLLIKTARDNRNAAVRKQAMFWLGQSDDPRALAFFEEVLAR